MSPNVTGTTAVETYSDDAGNDELEVRLK